MVKRMYWLLLIAMLCNSCKAWSGFLDTGVLEYGFTDDSKTQVYVKKCDTATTGCVTIPSYIVYQWDEKDENGEYIRYRRNCPVVKIANYAFAYCYDIEGVTIPGGVTSIGEDAFRRCQEMKSIVVPESVTSIGEGAFWQCRSLTSFSIPKGITRIENTTFENCWGLTRIIVPDNVKFIGREAFANCSAATEIVIGNSVEEIGEDAFRGCSSLKSMSIPDSVREIGVRSFIECESLLNVDIGAGVTNISVSAFRYTALTNVSFRSCKARIGGYAFGGCENLKGMQIPDNAVVGIDAYAFYRCSSLETVSIGKGVENIGDEAFYECASVENIKITSGTVGSYAFSGSSLRAIALGEDVQRLGHYAFGTASALKSVLFECEPPDVGVGAPPINLPRNHVAYGIYPPEKRERWDAVIGEDGTWNGLVMTEKKACEITLNGNGGVLAAGDCAGEIVICDRIAYMAQKIEKNPFVRTGYEFCGWATSSDGDVVYEDAQWAEFPGDAVLYARWAKSAIPELPLTATTEEVAAALDGSVDAKLAVNITDAADYAEYREWASGVKTADGSAVAGAEAVKNAANAWLSYALDTEALIANAPNEGDVTIDTFENAMTDGAFDFSVKVKGVAVGDGVLEANIRKVFDIQGVEDLATGTFSTDAVEVNAVAAEGGKVKFTVTPKDESGGLGTTYPASFFFKVKMK